jgi:hypothetical protein
MLSVTNKPMFGSMLNVIMLNIGDDILTKNTIC